MGFDPADPALRAAHPHVPLGVVQVIRRRWTRPIMTHAPLRLPSAEPSLMGMPDTAGHGTRDARHWTRDAVLALPDDGQRYELVSGELVVTPAPHRLHQRTVAALYRQLYQWVSATGLGEVLFSPADLTLGETEVLQPDLFVTRESVTGRSNDWSDIAALQLVVQVLSPGTAIYDRQLKRRRYQQAGVPEYWIVDPDARLIERWRPDDVRPEILTGRMTWQPMADLPAHELDVERFFRALFGEGAER